MSGVQLTKGHLADNGGLRGHSVDASVFPLVVVAVGNPHERIFWKVRRPDGQYYYKGFETAKLAGLFAANVKVGLIDCMTEFEYRAAGGYGKVWLGEGPQPALHRQQTEEQYLAILATKHRALAKAADFVHSHNAGATITFFERKGSPNKPQVKTISCFDGNNYNDAATAAASGALYVVGQYESGDDNKRESLLKAAHTAAKCMDSRAMLIFWL